MQKTDQSQPARTMRRQLQNSTTLNRRYVKRPVRRVDGITADASIVPINTQKQPQKISRSPKISRFGVAIQKNAQQKDNSDLRPAEAHPAQVLANRKLRERKQNAAQQQINRPTAKELKDQAIKKALLAASRQPQQQSMAQFAKKDEEEAAREGRLRFGPGRIILALSCAVVAVFALVYFVNLNMPDVQFRAAAAQLNANYPNYIPHDYTPSEIASENNIITIQFKNKNNGESFSIIEEKSSWNSNALLNNYIKPTFGDDYSTLREKGLTIYVNKNNASWVNGGTVYKLTMSDDLLSKKQITDIATSL